MPVNPTTDELFSAFSAEDRSFLKDFFAEHPRVGNNFVHFLRMPPGERLEAATEAIKHIERRGWVLRHVRNPETIFEHLEGTAKLVETELTGYPEKLGLSGKEANAFTARMIEMARIHDIHEALTTDFTPHDGITEENKARIELLAAKVIFEAFPDKYELTKEFTLQQTDLSKIINDYDKLHAVIKTKEIENEQPHLRGKLLADFLKYATRKIQTTEGKDLLMKIVPPEKQNMIILNPSRSR